MSLTRATYAKQVMEHLTGGRPKEVLGVEPDAIVNQLPVVIHEFAKRMGASGRLRKTWGPSAETLTVNDAIDLTVAFFAGFRNDLIIEVRHPNAVGKTETLGGVCSYVPSVADLRRKSDGWLWRYTVDSNQLILALPSGEQPGDDQQLTIEGGYTPIVADDAASTSVPEIHEDELISVGLEFARKSLVTPVSPSVKPSP